MYCHSYIVINNTWHSTHQFWIPKILIEKLQLNAKSNSLIFQNSSFYLAGFPLIWNKEEKDFTLSVLFTQKVLRDIYLLFKILTSDSLHRASAHRCITFWNISIDYDLLMITFVYFLRLSICVLLFLRNLTTNQNTVLLMQGGHKCFLTLSLLSQST